MKRCIVGVLMACSVLLAGCAAPLLFFGAGTVAGVTGYQYYQGALIVTYKAPYIRAWDAANKTVRDLHLIPESAEHDLTGGKIVAKRADGKRVVISLAYQSADETEARIRVGYLGDQQASKSIADQIRRNLFGR